MLEIASRIIVIIDFIVKGGWIVVSFWTLRIESFSFVKKSRTSSNIVSTDSLGKFSLYSSKIACKNWEIDSQVVVFPKKSVKTSSINWEFSVIKFSINELKSECSSNFLSSKK